MAEVSVIINFETNARAVKNQIRELNSQISTSQSSAARLNKALDAGKASSKLLTGDIRARQTIVKLDKQINSLAEQRMISMTRGAHFGAQDQFIKGLLKQNEVMRIQRKILDDNARAMINLGKNTQWAGRQLVVGFTVPLTIAAGAAMKAFSDLEKEIVKFKRVYGDINTTSAQTDAMADSVKKLATEWTKYGVAVSDTIGLAAEAAGAGFQGEKLMSQVKSATKLSVLGQLEMQKAMEATIAMQSTFQMSNQDLGKSINFLNQLENQTMVTMDDMTTAIPKAATVVQGLGGDIQDLGVMMAALREGGVTAAEGANALKSGLGSLLNPSKEAAATLKTIGIELPALWKESEKNGKGVIFVVEQLATALDTLGQTQKQQVIEELFGKHQFARMNALLSNINKGTQALSAKEVAVTGGLEAALIAQKELNKLGESSLTKFQAAIANLKASIAPLGKVIMDFVTPLIEGATKIIEKFNAMPDFLKKMAVGFTVVLGVAAPLFLMLIGQIQNLLGNGLKMVNWLRNWGKDTQWVAQENLTLAQSLAAIDTQLIAENALLQKNVTLWEQRKMAATTAGTPFTEPRPVPGGRRRRFATGGSVGGSGSGDTVPALLAPGEFVVNAKAAKKHSATLAAMNSGTLQGFLVGRPRAKGRTASATEETGPPLTESARRRQAIADKKIQGLSEKDLVIEKEKSRAKLMQFKTFEQRQLTTIMDEIASASPLLAKAISMMGIDVRQWDQSHIGKAESQRIIGMKGTGKEKIKPWNYKGDLILDNHLINIMLGKGSDHPIDIGEAQIYKSKIDSGKDISMPKLVLSQLMEWRTSGAGSKFYRELIDDNFLFMNLFGGKQKKITSKQYGHGFNESSILMAAGGFVPGTGNKDTVPAMLAPGEAVINKKASKKFGGILSAMNRGSVGMFAGGYTKEVQGTPLTDTQRAKLAEVFTRSVDVMVLKMADLFKYGAEKAKDLRDKIEQDQQAFDAAHVVREVDAEGNKIWRNENLVQTPKGENVKMEALSKSSQNLEVLNETAKRMGVAMDERTDLILRLTKQEHIVEQEQRELLASIIQRAEEERLAAIAAGKALKKSEQLSVSMRGVSGAAFAGSLGITPLNYATGKPMTKAEVDALRGPGGGGGKPPKPVPGAAAPDDDLGGVGKGRRRGFDPSNIFFAFTMLTGQFTGLTESMGHFGEALTVASTALMFMGNINTGGGLPGIFGLGGKGKGAIAGKFGKVGKAVSGKFGAAKALGAAKYAKYGLGAGLVGGAALGLGSSFIGNKISDQKGGTNDVIGKAVSWAGMGAGLGMMFGPWGAAIGGAAGALAGLTVQILANKKAQEQALESSRGAAVAWDKIGKELTEKYDIGGNRSLTDNTGLTEVLSDGNANLADMLSEQMANTDSEWNRRIADLTQQQARGQYLGVNAELRSLTLEMRGRGVDDASIQVMLDAFLQQLPGQLKEGLASAMLESNHEIVDDLADMSRQIRALGYLKFMPKGGGARPDMAGYNPDLKMIRAAGIGLNESIDSLTDTMLNAEAGSDEYKDALENLNVAYKASADLQGDLQKDVDAARKGGHKDEINKAQGALDELRAAAYASVQDYMTMGEGKDTYGQSAFDEFIKKANAGPIPALELSQEAMLVMKNGINITGMAPDVIAVLGKMITMRQSTLDAIATLEEKIAKYDADVQIIDNYESALDALKSAKADLKPIALEAKLTVARIDLEKRVLDKFVGEFNKAFGTAINSFADAQYEIDKIGNRIRTIQVRVIQPIQEEIDDFNRENELDQRKIAEIEDEKKKKAEETNKAFEDQADLLERIRAESEFINKEQSTTVSLAQALAKGDAAGAVQAMLESNRNVAEYSMGQQDRALRRAQGAAGGQEAEDPRITALQKKIDDRNKQIQIREDKIYDINEKQIEPIQRKADLMSLMLDTTKMELKYQQDNILGYDEENRQRNLARKAALDSVKDAKKRVTEQQKLVDGMKEEVREVQKRYDAEGLGIDETRAKMKTRNEEWTAGVKTMKADVKKIEKSIKEVAGGSQEAFNTWNKIVPRGGLANILAMQMEAIESGQPITYEEWLARAKADNPLGENPKGDEAKALPDDNGTNSPGYTPGPKTPPAPKGNKGTGGTKTPRSGNPRVTAPGSGTAPSGPRAGNPRVNPDAKPKPKPTPAPKPKGDESVDDQEGGNIKRVQLSGASDMEMPWPKDKNGKYLKLVNVGINGDRLSQPAYSSFKRVERTRGKAIHIQQGGFSDRIEASKGTHWGDGVLDVDWLNGQGQATVNAFHSNGWAAWHRYPPRYPHHIHAVQRGNKYASAQAKAQLNKGGVVPGTGNTDSVRAMLTPGEFVIRKSAVDAIGHDTLSEMNKYAAGGAVTGISPRDPQLPLKKKGKAKALKGYFTPKVLRGGARYIVNAAGDQLGVGALRSLSMVGRVLGHPIQINQGGYSHGRIPDSGTSHNGDGAIDTNWSADGYGPNAVIALRRGGWAAWHRGPPRFKGHHIHAIQIGNKGADPFAQWQVKEYLAGRDGTSKSLPDDGPRLGGMGLKKAVGFATGGLVGGAGKTDTIPSLLTPGEFVLRKGVVDRVGVKPLKVLNSGLTPRNEAHQVQGGDMVYNTYDMMFNIAEASDAYETARIIMSEMKRTNSSKVRRK